MKKGVFITLLVLFELLCVVAGVLCVKFSIALSVVLFVIALVLMITTIVGYNKLVRCRNKVKESLALIDIQLKLRFDLIPNLVETVKGYNKHEKELLEEIIKLRNLAVNAQSEEEKLEYANKIVPNLKSLIAVVENYPDLKSSALFKNLMEQLGDIEDRLVASRRIYDSNVNIYNSYVETFPRNILASVFDFKRETMFKIDAGENIATSIKF